MERRKLVKRKKKADKPQRQQYFDQPQDQIAYILTDTKETIVTENFYQPISLGILKQYLPCKDIASSIVYCANEVLMRDS